MSDPPRRRDVGTTSRRRLARIAVLVGAGAWLVACGAVLTRQQPDPDGVLPPAPGGASCTISPADVAGNSLGAYVQEHLAVTDCETIALDPGTYPFVRGTRGAGALATIADSGQSRRHPLLLTAADPAAPPTIAGAFGLYEPDWVTVSGIHFVGTQRCSSNREYVVKGALAMSGGEHWTVEHNEINGAPGGSFCGKAMFAITNTSPVPPYGEVPQAFRIQGNCLHGAGRPSASSPPEPAFAPGEFHLLYTNTIVTTDMRRPRTSLIRRNIFFDDPGGFAIKLNSTTTEVDHNTFDHVFGAEIVQENGGRGNSLTDPGNSAPRTGLVSERNLVVGLQAGGTPSAGSTTPERRPAFSGHSLALHGPVPAVVKWRVFSNSLYQATVTPAPAVAPLDNPDNRVDPRDYIAAGGSPASPSPNVRTLGEVLFNRSGAGSCSPGPQTAYRPSPALPYGLHAFAR